MYHLKLSTLVFTAGLLASGSVMGSDIENFNSRKGVPLKELKSKLQNSCWTFHQFDINQHGWNPSIEGDGAMVSSNTALQSGNAGIYTPLLTVKSSLSVSFNYKFNEDFEPTAARWIKLCLANAANEIVHVLDQLDLNGYQATSIRSFSTKYSNLEAGEYRLLLLYGGTGGSSRIAIDELTTSAEYKFPKGCDAAPSISHIRIAGRADRTASGSLLTDQSDVIQKPFLVEHAQNGKVELFPDGTFVFIPHNGFKGKSATFSYRLCNDQGNHLCSDPIDVTINFPGEHLVKFNGSYEGDGNVELAWHTNSTSDISRFDLERSTDGKNWKSAGTIHAAKLSPAAGNHYSYIDKVGKNTALKNDLYYRLKQITADGEVNTSNLMIVRVYNKRTLTMICVAPHPDKREVAVNVQLNENSMVTMRIYDHTNATIIHRSIEAPRGLNNLVIDGTRDLIPGNYLLEVIVNSKDRMMVNLIKE